jgi:hypothetical protein
MAGRAPPRPVITIRAGCQSKGTFFVLKEGEPGLLIEISKDWSSILGAHVLGATNGFTDDDVDGAKTDFSDIQWHISRHQHRAINIAGFRSCVAADA